jgi:hypothetical protein
VIVNLLKANGVRIVGYGVGLGTCQAFSGRRKQGGDRLNQKDLLAYVLGNPEPSCLPRYICSDVLTIDRHAELFHNVVSETDEPAHIVTQELLQLSRYTRFE